MQNNRHILGTQIIVIVVINYHYDSTVKESIQKKESPGNKSNINASKPHTLGCLYATFFGPNFLIYLSTSEKIIPQPDYIGVLNFYTPQPRICNVYV